MVSVVQWSHPFRLFVYLSEPATLTMAFSKVLAVRLLPDFTETVVRTGHSLSVTDNVCSQTFSHSEKHCYDDDSSNRTTDSDALIGLLSGAGWSCSNWCS